MLKSMLQERLRSILEATMGEFAAPLDSGRAERALKLQHRYAGIERNPSGDAVIKWHIPSQTSPGTVYECFISVKPKNMSLFAVANNVRDLRARVLALKEADVRCFCPCKDFRYSGAAYNMSHLHDGFEDGHGDAGSDIPPDVRDPERDRTICKHLAAAFKGMLTNASKIMKDARVAKFPKEAPNEVDIGPLSKRKKVKEAPAKAPDMFDRPAEQEPGRPPEVIPSAEKVISDKDAIPKMEGLNPVKIPEVKESLDALAGVLQKEGASSGDANLPDEPAEPVVPEKKDELPDEEKDGEVPEMPGLNEPEKKRDNLLYDLEDAKDDPIFSPGE